jgi:predicted dienelactone hydrolase
MSARLVPILLSLALITGGPARAIGCDGVWRDAARGRDVPVHVSLPVRGRDVPAVIWSPGMGGGVTNAGRWVRAWTDAGIAVVRVQHPGSDAAVYAQGGAPAERNARIRVAAAPAQVLARIADIGFIADELVRRRRQGACDLTRIDKQRLGLAGHSMGGWVAQAMAGQLDASGEVAPAVDRRFRAFIAMSTSGNPDPAAAGRQFGDIGRPLLVITGTRDGVPAGASPETARIEIAKRSAPFTGAPADGRKALLVVADASHMVFAGDSRRDPREAAMQDRTAAITTLWWRRWLMGGEPLGSSLDTPPLAAGDIWERK